MHHTRSARPECGRLLLLLIVLFAAVGGPRCGADAADASGAGGNGPWNGSDAASPGPEPDAGGAPASDVYVPPPPEQELDMFLQTPQVGDRYVFIVNTDLGTLVKVDARTLDVGIIDVGLLPTVCATVPGADVALVLNTGSHDVSLVRAAPERDTVQFLPVQPGANALRVSHTGQHAVAFFRYADLTEDAEVGSLQEVTLLRIHPGYEDALDVGVGYNPSDAVFVDDGTQVLVVTDAGITRIPLSLFDGQGAPVLFEVSDDPLAPAAEREVHVSPAGDYAVVRLLGKSALNVVDLQTRAIAHVPLPAEPTDLDLTRDGQRAVVVMREQHRAAVAQVADLATRGAEALTEVDLGTLPAGAAVLSPDGQHALLYSTLSDDEVLLQFDLADPVGTLRARALQKKVAGIAIGPASRRALLYHRNAPGTPVPGEPQDDFVDKSWGFSFYDLDGGRVGLQLTPGEPTGYAFSADDAQLFVLLPDPSGDKHEVAAVDLAHFDVSLLRLGSYPEVILDVESAGQMAVSQQHPTGRISFIDTTTGVVRTVTGYQLNSLIH